jgi:hypothetical protein
MSPLSIVPDFIITPSQYKSWCNLDITKATENAEVLMEGVESSSPKNLSEANIFSGHVPPPPSPVHAPTSPLTFPTLNGNFAYVNINTTSTASKEEIPRMNAKFEARMEAFLPLNGAINVPSCRRQRDLHILSRKSKYLPHREFHDPESDGPLRFIRRRRYSNEGELGEKNYTVLPSSTSFCATSFLRRNSISPYNCAYPRQLKRDRVKLKNETTSVTQISELGDSMRGMNLLDRSSSSNGDGQKKTVVLKEDDELGYFSDVNEVNEDVLGLANCISGKLLL